MHKHRKTNRLRGYNYSNDGYYFITICCQNRIKYFGGVYNGTMCVNRLGSIVWRQWEWLQTQYTHIRSHAFVVMPNHVHGILEIKNAMRDCVGTGLDLSLPDSYNKTHNPQKTLSLSNIIGAFKTTSSKLIHQNNFPQFAWQRSFHDHIIHNETAFQNIYNYIVNNPTSWLHDRNN